MCAPANCPRPENPVDVLIVGQGIAGSLLAWILHRHGQRVLIVDDGHKTSASVVAAGMINPVQGQRLNTIWEIQHCLPAAIALYQQLEEHFGQRFFYPRTILKLLKTQEEADILKTRLQDPAFTPYLGRQYPQNHFASIPDSENGASAPNTLHDPFGSIEIIGGGYLDTQCLLTTLRNYFASEGILIQAEFAHKDLVSSNPDSVQWQDFTARRIVFAEGWRILSNPLFAAYTFLPTKGQILTVQATETLPQYVINRGKWLVPQGEKTAWIGATFERGHTDILPTARAEAEILQDVQSFIPNNRLLALSTRTGIRLATPDYIPRVGFLPDKTAIGVFCAFGSKGNCLAPYLAERMASYIIDGSPLPPRADIATKKQNKGRNPVQQKQSRNP